MNELAGKRARIALVHALRDSIAPIEAAFAAEWPEARPMHLLDDALPGDLMVAGGIDVGIRRRFVALAQYAYDAGATAVLFTCSAFGSAIDAAAAAVPIPVRKPNAAMVAQALAARRPITLLATFEPTLASMPAEFDAAAGGRAPLTTVFVPGALAALQAGEVARHDDLLLAAALRHAPQAGLVALAQFSMARGAESLAAAGFEVLTTPTSAVVELRSLLQASLQT